MYRFRLRHHGGPPRLRPGAAPVVGAVDVGVRVARRRADGEHKPAVEAVHHPAGAGQQAHQVGGLIPARQILVGPLGGHGDQGVQVRPLRVAGVADAQVLVVPLRPGGVGVDGKQISALAAVGPGAGQGVGLFLVGAAAWGAAVQIPDADAKGTAPTALGQGAPGLIAHFGPLQRVGRHIVRKGDMQKRAHGRRGGGVPVKIHPLVTRHHHRLGEGAGGHRGQGEPEGVLQLVGAEPRLPGAGEHVHPGLHARAGGVLPGLYPQEEAVFRPVGGQLHLLGVHRRAVLHQVLGHDPLVGELPVVQVEIHPGAGCGGGARRLGQRLRPVGVLRRAHVDHLHPLCVVRFQMNPQGGVLAVQADVREGGVGGQGKHQQRPQHRHHHRGPPGGGFPLQGPLDPILHPCLPKAGGQQGPPAGGGQGQQGGGVLPGAAAGFQHSLVAFQLQIPHQQNPGQPENRVEPVDAHDQKIDELTPGVAQLDVALLVAAHPPQVLPLQPGGDVHPGADHAEHEGGGDPVALPPPSLPDGALPHGGGQQGTGSQPGEQGIAPHRDHTGQPHPGQDVRERQPFRLGLRFRGGLRLGDDKVRGGAL